MLGKALCSLCSRVFEQTADHTPNGYGDAHTTSTNTHKALASSSQSLQHTTQSQDSLMGEEAACAALASNSRSPPPPPRTPPPPSPPPSGPGSDASCSDSEFDSTSPQGVRAMQDTSAAQQRAHANADREFEARCQGDDTNAGDEQSSNADSGDAGGNPKAKRPKLDSTGGHIGLLTPKPLSRNRLGALWLPRRK